MQAEGGRGIIGTPGHSPALRYELQLVESKSSSGPEGPTHARINLCFDLLGDLLPHLGVYQRVVGMIRDELHAAVYSDEYTSGGGRRKGGGGGGRRRKRGASKEGEENPERLPYFTIARRCMEKRKEEMSKLENEIASLEEQLYTCEADLEKASSATEAYRHDVRDRDTKIHKLSNELRNQMTECERLQKIVNQHQRAQDRLQQEVEFRMSSLQSSIATLTEENTDLNRYKNTHDKLQQVLAHPKKSVTASTDPPASKQAQTEQHVATAELLNRQLLQIQNTIMDEYDSFMSSHISEMADGQALDVHRMIRQQQKIFKKNIAAVSNELSLLHSHHDALSSQLHVLASPQSKHASPHLALVTPTHPSNPLVPQEQVFSKYAAMLSTSTDGGKIFYPLKEAQFCLSCGEKTVICPHKAFSSDLTVTVPLHSTHLRISRPQLRVAGHVEETKKTQDSNNDKSVKQTQKQHGLYSMSPDFKRIWLHFHAKFPATRAVPRSITPDQLMLLLHQFYASVLQKDDTLSVSGGEGGRREEEPTLSLMGFLFEYMSTRYLIPEIVPLATHDFLSALEKHHTSSKEFLVVSHVLSCDLDGSAVRYLLLLAQLVDTMPWLSAKEFTPWAAIVYPNLQEEDVEQLAMDFVAHGNNRVSKHLVMEFFTWLVLRHKEPRIAMLESKLVDHPCKKPGTMLEVEFAEVMDSLVSLVPDRLCRHLFMQGLAAMVHGGEEGGRNGGKEGGAGQQRDTMPIKRLAYIAAYVSLLRSAPTLLTELGQLAHRMMAASVAQPPPNTRPQVQQVGKGERGDELYTLERVRSMASNMK